MMALVAAAALLLVLAQRARADADMALPVPTAGAPVVVTTSDSATITVTVDQGPLPLQWSVQYGTSVGYGATTAPVAIPAGTGTSTVTTTIAGLWADGTYHFRSVLLTAAAMFPGADATFATQTAATGVDDGEPQDTEASGLDLGPDAGAPATPPAAATDAPAVAPPAAAVAVPADCLAAPPLGVQAAGCTPALTAERQGGRSILALLLPPGTTAASLTLPKAAANALAGVRVTVRTRTRSVALALAGRARTATKAGVRVRRSGPALSVAHLPAGTASVRVVLRTAVAAAHVSASISTGSTAARVR